MHAGVCLERRISIASSFKTQRETDMNATVNSATAGYVTPSPAGSKPLWAAVGVLGVCVLALGASLVHVTTRPAEPDVPGLTSLAAPQTRPATSIDAAIAVPAHRSLAQDEVIVEKSPAAAVQKPAATKPAPRPVVAKAAAPVAHPAARAPAEQAPVVVAANTPPVEQPVPVVVQAPAPKAVCGNCGTIESVTPVTRKGPGGPVGVIAGGVIGGVLGHQVGGGTGKDLATVLGAVGGAVAGNAVEKNMKKETVYSVRVRMEDGSVRTLEQANAPATGAKVTVDGSSLRGADGNVISSAPHVQKTQ
jgi:outer membrane lipoprotein SlyB